jgi:hypothetical protein
MTLNRTSSNEELPKFTFSEIKDCKRIEVTENKNVIGNVAATNLDCCSTLSKFTSRLKEFLGLNVRVQMQCGEKTVHLSMNVNSLAKNSGLTSFNERRFLKKILISSKFANNCFKRMALKSSHAELLQSTTKDIKEGEALDRLEAATDQNVCIDESLLSTKNVYVCSHTDPSTKKIHKLSINIIKRIGCGAANNVYLGWDKQNKKFVAIRKSHRNQPQETEKNINNSREFYQQLQEQGEEDMKLIEEPGLFVEENEVPEDYFTSDSGVSSIINLAIGSLEKKKDSFYQKPKQLVDPLLRGLRKFIRAGIGMGDVKEENINIYKTPEGKLIPKFSDLDGSLSVKLHTNKLITVYKLAREAIPDQKRFNQLTKAAITEEVSTNSLNMTLKEKEAFQSLIEIGVTLTEVSTTDDRTLGYAKDRKLFVENSRQILYEALKLSTEENYEETISTCVENLVSKTQDLDIKGTARSIIGTVLNLSKNDEEMEKTLTKILSNAKKEDDEDKILITNALNKNQERLPKEDRLPEGTIELLADMLSGQVSSNKEGLARINALIDQM